MFFRKDRPPVELLPHRVDTKGLPWCREALLLHVDGTGALGWEDCGPAEDPGGRRHLRLTLRGAPLLSWAPSGCPTCESLLAAGWGLDRAEGPELDALRAALNGGFPRLEAALPALTPLLALLPTGCYVLADGDACPADGGGRFFWDVPDQPESYAATAPVELTDEDYAFTFVEGAPVFLYPSQRRSRFDPDRAAYYEERLQQEGPPPRGLALHVQGWLSLLLDGHHKATAAARLGRTLPCLTVLPFAGYQYRPGPGRQAVPDRALFGPLAVPLDALPARWRPDPRAFWKRPPGPPLPLAPGRLADRDWPETDRAAGGRYPTAREYALVTAAEIGYPTDGELERWLDLFREYGPQLRAALVLLRTAGDPRLKEAALRCAAIPDRWSSLKEEAFRILAALRGDPDAERFFIDYFVSLDDASGREALTDIAHSFWAEDAPGGT